MKVRLFEHPVLCHLRWEILAELQTQMMRLYLQPIRLEVLCSVRLKLPSIVLHIGMMVRPNRQAFQPQMFPANPS
jgi:hypothetical protein